MKWNFSVLCLFLAALVPDGAMAQFVVDDQIASDPSVDLKDPEFDPIGMRMTWQDLAGNLWVALVDPETGDLIPPSGRAALVDSGLPLVFVTQNGPEFAYGEGRTHIVYTQQVEGKMSLARAVPISGSLWVPLLLPGGEERLRPFGNEPGFEDTGKLAYVHNTAAEGRKVAWRTIGDPASEVISDDLGTIGGRWAPGGQALVVTREVGDTKQVVWFDIESSVITPITPESVLAANAFAWHDPQLEETLVSIAVDTTRVDVYRNLEGQWVVYKSIQLPAEFPFISSPEPFVYAGRSYISVIGTTKLRNEGLLPFLPDGPSSLWIAAVDPQDALLRRIDDTSRETIKLEPEPFLLKSGPSVYYTETDPFTNNALLRIASTGLGGDDLDADGVLNIDDNCIALANPDQYDADDDGFGNLCDGDLNGNCLVDKGDGQTLIQALGSALPQADLDGNGIVDGSDYVIWRDSLYRAPGLSAGPTCRGGLGY